ncbi:MAG: hypothetical protein ABI680_17035 [Chthoniobacteraceae bacterium]
MKLAPLVASILAVGLAGFAPKVSAAEIDDQDLILLLTKLVRLRKQMVDADSAARPSSASPRVTGLQTTSLATYSVQGASGLDSGACGLTPQDEWRRMFPRHDQR